MMTAPATVAITVGNASSSSHNHTTTTTNHNEDDEEHDRGSFFSKISPFKGNKKQSKEVEHDEEAAIDIEMIYASPEKDQNYHNPQNGTTNEKEKPKSKRSSQLWQI